MSAEQVEQKRVAANRLQPPPVYDPKVPIPLLPTGSQGVRPPPTPSSHSHPQGPRVIMPSGNQFTRQSLPPRPPKAPSTPAVLNQRQPPSPPPVPFARNPAPNQLPPHDPTAVNNHSSGSCHKRKQPMSSSDDIKSESACLDYQQPRKYASIPLLEERYYCELGKVHCLCKMNYEMHIKGRKHKFMTDMSAIKGGVCAGGGGSKGDNNNNHHQELLRCELCEIWCMNGVAMHQHLKGKKHLLNIKKKMMKLPNVI